MLISKEKKKHARYFCAAFGERKRNIFVSYNDKIIYISTVIQEHIKPATICCLRGVCLENFTPGILKEMVSKLSGLLFSNCLIRHVPEFR